MSNNISLVGSILFMSPAIRMKPYAAPVTVCLGVMDEWSFIADPHSAFWCDSKAAFMLILRRQNQRFENADSKRRSKTPLIQAIVRAQVNRKGVYMTSFKRGYNVILRSCFHQNQRFALTTIVNAHLLGMRSCLFCEGVLKRWFKTPIQNAVHGSTVHASLEKKTIRLPKKACLGILGMFNSGYCSSSSEPERRLYDVI